jgi:CheY-like chemotaxis protein
MTEEQKTILVVDDNEEFVESNKDLLESEGYRVIVAYDGESGFELAKKEQPDLMILDVMMATKTEGFEISRKIPNTPELQDMTVLLVTGIRHDMHLPFSFEKDETWLPVDEVFEKPIAPQTLLDEIKKRLS